MEQKLHLQENSAFHNLKPFTEVGPDMTTGSEIYRSIGMGFDFYRAWNEGGLMELYLDVKGVTSGLCCYLYVGPGAMSENSF